MNQQFGPLLYTISVWALPAIIAITFHEAAHGFVARSQIAHRQDFSVAANHVVNGEASRLARALRD
jgi:hypothetical protein